MAHVRFVNVLWPTTMEAWREKPATELVGDTGKAVAIRVSRTGGGVREDILTTYAPSTSVIVAGPYRYDARMAVLAYDAQGDLTRLVVYGGTFVRDQAKGRVLVENLASSEPFEAIFYARTVVISGNISTAVTLYAPEVETVAAGGQLLAFDRSGDWITFDGSELGVAQPSVANLCTAPVEFKHSSYLPSILR
jgi:hypothetical protein